MGRWVWGLWLTAALLLALPALLRLWGWVATTLELKFCLVMNDVFVGRALCCVFHKKPVPALTGFFPAATRWFLVSGVFSGLFVGLRRHNFFWGSFWRIRAMQSPFWPRSLKMTPFWKCFLGPRGLQATALHRLGFGLAARGREEPGQAAVCLRAICLRGRSSAAWSIDRFRC